MTPFISDIMALAGLLLTFAGAGMTAQAVILTPLEAVHIGVARWASSDWKENVKQPAVQNLLRASRNARRGLALVAVGSLLQIVPIVARLAHAA